MTDEVRTLIDDATFEFSMGEPAAALEKLRRATGMAPSEPAAWHALAEVLFQERQLDDALAAAEVAHQLGPDDVFVNTSLSRIWMEKGDKSRAEHFGARARVLGWKDQLHGG
jgi:cytochrome c-type biogenesis protein CcmH/NrfG